MDRMFRVEWVRRPQRGPTKARERRISHIRFSSEEWYQEIGMLHTTSPYYNIKLLRMSREAVKFAALLAGSHKMKQLSNRTEREISYEKCALWPARSPLSFSRFRIFINDDSTKWRKKNAAERKKRNIQNWFLREMLLMSIGFAMQLHSLSRGGWCNAVLLLCV